MQRSVLSCPPVGEGVPESVQPHLQTLESFHRRHSHAQRRRLERCTGESLDSRTIGVVRDVIDRMPAAIYLLNGVEWGIVRFSSFDLRQTVSGVNPGTCPTPQ